MQIKNQFNLSPAQNLTELNPSLNAFKSNYLQQRL